MKITRTEAIRFNENIIIGGCSGGTGKSEFCWISLLIVKDITDKGEFIHIQKVM